MASLYDSVSEGVAQAGDRCTIQVTESTGCVE